MLTIANDDKILDEVAAILALGFLRLHKCKKIKNTTDYCKIPLDSPDEESVHGAVLTE